MTKLWLVLRVEKVSKVVPNVLISLIALAIVWIDITHEEYKVEWVHVALVLVAFLPWAHSFLNSINVSATGIEIKLKELTESVTTIVESQAAPDDLTLEPTKQEQTQIDALDVDQKLILKVIANSNYSLRSVSGVRAAASIPKSKNVKLLLEELSEGEFVRKATGRKGNVLWAITSKGRQAI